MLVILGAGASADAGLPTYQSVTVPPESVLNCLTLNQDPDRVWSYLSPLLQPIDPDPTYRSLESYIKESGIPDDKILVINQNIDGLASRSLPGRVLEIHGNVHRAYCLSCEWTGLTKDLVDSRRHPLPVAGSRSCPTCAGVCRPDIVLYRETPFHRGHIDRFIKTYITTDSEILVIGTSMRLPYLRVWVNKAKQRGGKVIHLNSDPGYNNQYWEPLSGRPYGRGGKYRSLVGKGERWLKNNKDDAWSPATAIEGSVGTHGSPATAIEGLSMLTVERQQRQSQVSASHPDNNDT